jgi:pseudouridine kinase
MFYFMFFNCGEKFSRTSGSGQSPLLPARGDSPPHRFAGTLIMARILAIGGAHIDRKGWLSAPHRPGASNPGHWESEAGGGVFNAARNLARLGHQVTLVAPRGGDAAAEAGGARRRRGRSRGLPADLPRPRHAELLGILEPDGNLVTALADMALYDLVPARRLLTSRLRKRLGQADLLLMPIPTCPKAPSQLLAEAAASLGGAACRHRRLAGQGGALEAEPCKDQLPRHECRRGCGADRRAAAITRDWQSLLASAGLTGGIVTSGAGPVAAFSAASAGPASTVLLPPPLDQVRDVVGAGDALASGYLDGWLAGDTIGDSLTRGIALARLTASVRGPVRQDLSRELLAQALKTMAKPAQYEIPAAGAPA